MIYLGLYAGFINSDVATVEAKHFKGEFVEYPRPKTAVARKAWLPSDAIEAVEAVEWPLRTKRGNLWTGGVRCNPISAEFKKLASPLGVELSFSSFRHTTQTIMDRSRDTTAVSHVMGHILPGMSATYHEGIEDDRLRACGECMLDYITVNAQKMSS